MTYVLERNQEEYARLSDQARMWEPATARIFERIGLGPAGHVTGIDVDAGVGAYAIDRLHGMGHRQTTFEPVHVDDTEGTFDLVFARLLLLHVDDHAVTLKRLWDRVAPGGHLVVMDHDMRNVDVVPPLASADEFFRVVLDTMTAAGRDIELGRRLPRLYEEAGIGPVDGVDVVGRLEPLSVDRPMFEAIFRSLLPAAIAHGITTAEAGERWFCDFAREVAEHGERRAVWPVMVATWKGK